MTSSSVTIRRRVALRPIRSPGRKMAAPIGRKPTKPMKNTAKASKPPPTTGLDFGKEQRAEDQPRHRAVEQEIAVASIVVPTVLAMTARHAVARGVRRPDMPSAAFSAVVIGYPPRLLCALATKAAVRGTVFTGRYPYARSLICGSWWFPLASKVQATRCQGARRTDRQVTSSLKDCTPHGLCPVDDHFSG